MMKKFIIVFLVVAIIPAFVFAEDAWTPENADSTVTEAISNGRTKVDQVLSYNNKVSRTVEYQIQLLQSQAAIESVQAEIASLEEQINALKEEEQKYVSDNAGSPLHIDYRKMRQFSQKIAQLELKRTNCAYTLNSKLNELENYKRQYETTEKKFPPENEDTFN